METTLSETEKLTGTVNYFRAGGNCYDIKRSSEP
jgi:hypothetical protein